MGILHTFSFCSKALHSKHATEELYPEDKLLPDYNAIERKKMEVCLVCMLLFFVCEFGEVL